MSFFRSIGSGISSAFKSAGRAAGNIARGGMKVLSKGLENPVKEVLGAVGDSAKFVLGDLRQNVLSGAIGAGVNALQALQGGSQGSIMLRPMLGVQQPAVFSSSRPMTETTVLQNRYVPPNMSNQLVPPMFGGSMDLIAPGAQTQGTWLRTGTGYQQNIGLEPPTIQYTPATDQMSLQQVMPPGGNILGRGTSQFTSEF